MTIAPGIAGTPSGAVTLGGVDEIVWDARELGYTFASMILGYQARGRALRGVASRVGESDLIEGLKAVARTRAALDRVEVELVREALTRGLPSQTALSAINWVRTTEGGAVPPPDAGHAARVVRIANAAALDPDAVTDRTITTFYAGGLSATKTDQVLRLVADVHKVTDESQLAEVVEAMRAGSVDGPDPLAPATDDTSARVDGDESDTYDDRLPGRNPAVPSWVTGMAPDPAAGPDGRGAMGPAGWGLTSRELGKAINYTRRMLKPADLLLEEQAAAKRGRALHVLPGPGGLSEYRLTVDDEGAALIDAAVAALSRPTATTADGGVDLRSAAHRRADALLMVIQRGMDAAAQNDPPGRPRAQVVVTIGLADLLAQTNGAGVTATGQVLSPAEVRRQACDAGIIPMVLGGRGEPLDVGREKRFFTDAQRAALFERDRHCTFPGCTIPAQWCDAHHLTPWAKGGRTDLAVGALLCRSHHSHVHENHLTATMTAMGVRWNLQT